MYVIFNSTSTYLRGICLISLFLSYSIDAAELSIESDVKSRIEYNDNIFLTPLPHESVTGLIVTPSVRLRARERNWETFLNASLRSNNYSDENLDSNDVYFDLTGSHTTERNSYSLNGTLDYDSNLNSETVDFGITGRRVDRELKSITPQYTRFITERLMLSLNYSYTDVDYEDAVNTGLIPYATNVAGGSVFYNVTETDQFTFILQGSAYDSKDNTTENTNITSRIGMNHELSESFSVNYLVGRSRSETTRRDSQPFNFLGQIIVLPQVTDFSNTGLVLDAGFEKKWLASSLDGQISRDVATSSFGSLDEQDSINLAFRQAITQTWRYSISTRYEKSKSVNTGDQFADREIFSLEPTITHSLDRNWSMNASYRYMRRKFDTGGNDQPFDSYRVFVGIIYNFPSISTF